MWNEWDLSEIFLNIKFYSYDKDKAVSLDLFLMRWKLKNNDIGIVFIPYIFFNLVLLQSSSGMKSILLFYCGIPKLNWKDEEKSGEMRLTLKNTIIQILQLTEH